MKETIQKILEEMLSGKIIEYTNTDLYNLTHTKSMENDLFKIFLDSQEPSNNDMKRLIAELMEKCDKQAHEILSLNQKLAVKNKALTLAISACDDLPNCKANTSECHDCLVCYYDEFEKQAAKEILKR